MQIAVPSRTDVKEYQDLKEEMDQLVGKINGEFSTANWSPIRYIYGSISQVTRSSNFFYNTGGVNLYFICFDFLVRIGCVLSRRVSGSCYTTKRRNEFGGEGIRRLPNRRSRCPHSVAICRSW